MGKKRDRRLGVVRAEKQAKKNEASTAGLEDDNVVSAAKIAAVLSDPPFGDRWVRELCEKGYLVRVGRAKYDLEKSVQGYIRFLRETELKPNETESTSRAQFELERARKLKLENDQAEAVLIDTQLAINAVDAVVGVYQSEVHSIPARVTSDVALRRAWEIEIDRVSDAIAARCDKAIANLEAGKDPLDNTGEDDA